MGMRGNHKSDGSLNYMILCSGNGGSWGQLPSAQKDMDWIEENVDGELCK